MPVGLETYDALGKVLLSTDVLTMALRKTGTGTAVASDAGSAVPSMLKPPIDFRNYTWPLVAISCASPFGFFGLHSTTFEPRYGCAGAIGTSYTYYLFDVSTTIPNTTFGLEVYNSSGQRAYSAAQRSAKPLAVLTDNRASDTGAAFPTFTATGKQLAIAIPHWAGWQYWPPNGMCYDNTPAEAWEPGIFCSNLQIQQDYKMLGGKITNGGQTASLDKITYEDITISTSSGGYSSHNNYAVPLTALVMDVTLFPVPATVF